MPGRPLATSVETGPGESLTAWRFLPALGHWTVGPWCLLDEWGPQAVPPGHPVVIGSHPHLGADVLTVVLEGELHHRDSLGNHLVVRPGSVLLMRSTTGMCHAQDSGASTGLHALELWATTVGVRAEPSVELREQTAVLRLPMIDASVLVGEVAGVRAQTSTHADAEAALLRVEAGAGLSTSTCWLPLRRLHEHALLLLDGDLAVDGHSLDPGVLAYLGSRVSGVDLRSTQGCRCLLIGGVPVTEPYSSWWNLVAGSNEEIVSARALWSAHSPLFGKVHGAAGKRAEMPVLPGIATRSRR